MTPGLLYDPIFLDHPTGAHPESPVRLTATVALLRERGLWDRLVHLPFGAASREALEAVHTPAYLERVRTLSERGPSHLTPDTPMGRGSWQAATHAAGAAIAAVDAVLEGRVPSALALVRPPGHHATPDQGMGFCLLNHVAAAAAHARGRHGVRRVLIVDFDVHHGNGTQEIFYDDPTVLFFSLHQYPAYPGTGDLDETGRGEGEGTTINVPLPAQTGDAGIVAALDQILLPAARAYRPELILASAGYDAHWTNSRYLNGIRMRATVAGFGEVVSRLRVLAEEQCGGRLVLSLEGGYDPAALAWSVDATLRVLLGEAVEDPVGEPPPGFEPDVEPVLRRVRELHFLE